MTESCAAPRCLQAAADTAGGYGHFPGIGARGAVWIAAEVHLMFAAFVLGVPMFAVICELIGIVGKDEKYDKLSKEFTRLLVFAYSATALWGGLLLFFLTTLYPRFWTHMARDLQPVDVDLRRTLLHRVVHAVPVLLRVGSLEGGSREVGTLGARHAAQRVGHDRDVHRQRRGSPT